MKSHDEKMAKIMRKFSKIYHFFGGDINNAPNILDHTIRAPKIAKINKYIISSLESKLTYPDEYLIQRDSNGLYKIGLDSSLIYCVDCDPMPWMQSERWRNIVSM